MNGLFSYIDILIGFFLGVIGTTISTLVDYKLKTKAEKKELKRQKLETAYKNLLEAQWLMNNTVIQIGMIKSGISKEVKNFELNRTTTIVGEVEMLLKIYSTGFGEEIDQLNKALSNFAKSFFESMAKSKESGGKFSEIIGETFFHHMEIVEQNMQRLMIKLENKLTKEIK